MLKLEDLIPGEKEDKLHESRVGDHYITIGETLEAMEKSYKKLNRLVSKMEFKDNSPEIVNLKKVESAIFDLKKIFGDSYDFNWAREPSKRKISVRDLLGALNKIESFEEYHNKNAYPDDYEYVNIPIDLLSRYGFNEKVLDKISENTADYQGYIYVHKEEVSITFGDG